MGDPLDALDRRLLDLAQGGVPLVPRPFLALGQALGRSEAEVRARLARLAAEGVVRQIGAVFDTRACGYASALVAARVGAGRLEAAARAIGEHPGVSHCYERAHAWNLWFTLAVPPASALGLAGTVERLGALAGVDAVRLLPALRTFKIAARFSMDEGEGAGAGGLRGSPAAPTDAACPAAALTAEEIAVVRALQRPLALVEAPFAAPAREAGMTESALLDRARGLRERGVMRRFAALLDHRRAGFGANVMAVWAVPAARVAEAGARVAALAAVTHCYERPVFGDWPWALFGMIHGRTRQACLEAVGAIRRAIEPEGEALLWTVREFKKTRLTLFTPAYDAWEAAALAEARR